MFFRESGKSHLGCRMLVTQHTHIIQHTVFYVSDMWKSEISGLGDRKPAQANLRQNGMNCLIIVGAVRFVWLSSAI